MNEEYPDVQDNMEGIELPEVDLDQGDSGGGGGGGAGKRIIFAVVVVVMLAVQAVGSHFIIKSLFFSEPPRPKPEKEATSEMISEIYNIGGIIVNPKETRGTKHLLVDLGIQPSNTKVLGELEEIEPLLRDNINTFLAAQRFEVLTDITMREKIRKRIQEIVNYHLTSGTAEKVYFTRYVLQ